MITAVRTIVRERGVLRFVFETLLVVQLLHLGEHLAQMIQLFVLGWPAPQARGLVSPLDVEKVHFVWNLGVLAALIWLTRRGLRNVWLLATLLWATLHTSEHAFLLTNALLNGMEGQPGILGAGGWLERHGVAIPGVTTWSRASIHFAWNTVEVGLLCVAYVPIVARGQPRWRRSMFRLVKRAALLGLALSIPSTAGAPVDTIAALAPPEIWIDGFRSIGGIALDSSGVLYVADTEAGTVTRVAPDRSRVLVATGLDRPVGLAVDADGRLLIAEEQGGRVVRVEAGGGRTPLAAGLHHPRWLSVGDADLVFITAGEPARILVRRPSGQIATFADDFKNLEGLAFAAGTLFAAAQGHGGGPETHGVVIAITVMGDGTAGATSRLGPAHTFHKPVGP